MAMREASVNTAAEVDEMAGNLRVFNLVIGLVHLAQAIAMLALSNDFSLQVTRSFLTGPPGTEPAQEPWFGLMLGPAVAAFLLLAAIDHPRHAQAGAQ